MAQTMGFSEDPLPLPQTAHEAHQCEQFLALEMEKLSLEEEDLLQLQLYGLNTPGLIDPCSDNRFDLPTPSAQSPEITPNTTEKVDVDNKLQKFEVLLAKTLVQTTDKKTAYELAYYWNPKFC